MTSTRLKLTSSALKGECTIVGDKSISHRSLIFSGVARGTTTIKGLLTSDDVIATANAMRKWGITISKQGDDWQVQGRGINGLSASPDVIDCGNSLSLIHI